MEDVNLERLVLPALLALLILGMFLILVTSGGGSDDSLAPPLQPVAAETTPARKNTASSAPAPKPVSGPSGRFAKVADGDTATSIAQRAGLTVERLAELNPSIDLDSLRLGQTLKLLP
ncbi:MAG TPA: LysM peptidoglycan-binding domain-containing protein [Solirubrobacteraceae bacterium]|nr:LysM peptidoglycan-binding domain-containing protein [Solirubrobacteraceae bacterium]